MDYYQGICLLTRQSVKIRYNISFLDLYVGEESGMLERMERFFNRVADGIGYLCALLMVANDVEHFL